MAKKKIYEQDFAGHLGATLQFVAAFVAVALLSCGTPLGMFQNRNSQECLTLWGRRDSCWRADYSWRVDQETCHDRRRRFEAAEAFIIVALFDLLMIMFFCFTTITGGYNKVMIIALSALGVGSTCVPWAVVTAIYFTEFCGDRFVDREIYKYGTGYALTVASFCVQCVGMLLFIFLEPNKEKAEKRKEYIAERDARRRAEKEAAENATSSDEDEAPKKGSSSSAGSDKKSGSN